MVAVHNIPLDRYEAGSASGAVAFSLSAQSARGRVHYFPADGWEVELRRGSEHVVARTNQPLTGNALIDVAIDHAHRALDLMSVEDGDHLVTKEPAENHIVSEFVDGRRIVRFRSVSDFLIDVEGAVTVTRPDGTTEPQPTRQVLPWTPAFRFHRLSQSSRDLFDAYRNMFLGLEALLDQLFPKRSREGEKAWLQRSLISAGSKVNLAQLATPGTPDPACDLVDRLYEIRVHLFHAKTGRTLIPDERVSYTKVADSYPILLKLWTEIVREWLSLRRGGGVITYQGFQMMIENAYASTRIGVTADDTPPSETETMPSPRALPMLMFTEPTQLIEVQPGRMSLHGRTEVPALPADQVIGRVFALNMNSILQIVASIKGGLTLDGADVFEVTNILRLINRGQPRTEFS